MRLVFVHGINNQDNSSEAIIRDWSNAIKEAVGDPGLFDGVEVDAPFYGDLLHQLTKQSSTKSQAAVAQGMSNQDKAQEKLNNELLIELAQGMGISDAEISSLSGEPVSEMGVILDNVLLPLIGLLEDRIPGAGEFALQFVKQANTYLEYPGAKSEIDELVKPFLSTGEPQIVIGHSLGSLVTYSILREINSDTDLYLTIGSPLPLKTVRKKLGPPRKIPNGVEKWVNGIDRSDQVTLGQTLNANNFADGIENITDIDNGFGLKAHSVVGYLSHNQIANLIATTIRQHNSP